MRKTALISASILALVVTPVASQSIFSQPSAVGNNSVLSIDNSRGVLTMAPLLDRVSPAVVSIRTEAAEKPSDERSEQEELFERFFGRQLPRGGQRRGGSAGSGVIVDAGQGYILTNNHVVEGADEILSLIHI